MLRTIISFSVSICLVFTSCSADSKQVKQDASGTGTEAKQGSEQAANTTQSEAANTGNSSAIATFITNSDGSKIWKTSVGGMSFDFQPQGKLIMHAKRGKDSQWQGTWKVSGDKISMSIPELGKTIENSISIDGDDLLIESTRYKKSVSK